MSNFVRVCGVGEVEPGTGKVVEVGDKAVAVFHAEGGFHVLDNECPHRGGPLGEGELNGCFVTCPWHAWDFDVRTGESQTDDLMVARYDVKIDGDDVLAAL